MMGPKSAFAAQAGGFILASGLLAAMMMPSTALHAGGRSPLEAYKHQSSDADPSSDGTQGSEDQTTFPADPPAMPYPSPDRPFETVIDYNNSGDDPLSVSREAEGFRARSKRHAATRTHRETVEDQDIDRASTQAPGRPVFATTSVDSAQALDPADVRQRSAANLEPLPAYPAPPAPQADFP